MTSMKIVDDFVKMMRKKRYSFSTISSYKSALTKFLDAFPDTSPDSLTESHVELFIHQQAIQSGISASYYRLLIEVLKLFYKDFLNKNYDFLQQYPDQRVRKLPLVLSKDEVRMLIDSIKNLKHEAIISTIYSAGLRLEELLDLTPQDIDEQKMTIFIRGSSGKRYRSVPLSIRLCKLLKEYSTQYKPTLYLFEGQHGGRYSSSMVREIFKSALAKTGIRKEATPHTLRHSYAVHLLEAGTDIEIVRKLLGHSSIRTTKIYTQLSSPSIESVKSPFDEL